MTAQDAPIAAPDSFTLDEDTPLSVSAQSLISRLAGTGSPGYSGDGGPGAAAAFNRPSGAAVGPDGSVYVADTQNFRVRRVAPDGIVTAFAGNGSSSYSGDGGPATSAGIGNVFDVAVDAAGRVYLSDYYRVRVVDLDGTIHTFAGNGSWNFSGDNGPATSASLATAKNLAVGPDGGLYILDADNRRVRKVGTDGIIRSVAGNGQTGFSGDGGLATQAKLNLPVAIAVDPNGKLFIADSGNMRVRVVDTAGVITTFAGNGTQGFSGDGGPAAAAALAWPSGVAVDAAGVVYISDTNNNRVRRVTMDGKIATVAGNGSGSVSGDGGSPTSAGVRFPEDLAIGANGNWVIVERSDSVLRKVTPGAGLLANDLSPSGGGMTAVLSASPAHGALTLQADGGFTYLPAENFFGPDIFSYKAGNGAYFSAPVEVTLTVRPINDAPVALSTTVAGYEDAAVAFTLAGTDPEGDALTYSIVTAPAYGTLQGTPPALTYLPGQNFNGTDSLTFRVSDGLLSSTGSVAFSIAPVNDPPSAVSDSFVAEAGATLAVPGAWGISTLAGDGTGGFSGDGGPASAALLNTPSRLAYDAAGNLFFADAGNRRVRRIDRSGVITTIAGNGGTAPVPDGQPALSAGFMDPHGIAVDGLGRVYVCDRGGHAVFRIGTEGLITKVAGTGAAGFSGDGGPATLAALSSPVGLAIDGVGRLLIADRGNDRVRRVRLDGTIETIAGTGVSGPLGDGGPATAAMLPRPTAVAVGPDGTIFVAADQDNRVRRIDSAGVITTLAGNGASGYSGDGGDGRLASLYNPTDVALGEGGEVLIVDAGNNRIRSVGPSGLIRTVAGTGAIGFSGDGGPATEAAIGSARGLAVGPVGQLALAGYNNRMRLLTARGGILANDSDLEGSPFAARLNALPANGTAVLTAGGGFRYTPRAGFTGTDVFSYFAHDGDLGSAPVDVTLDVRPENQSLSISEFAVAPAIEGSTAVLHALLSAPFSSPLSLVLDWGDGTVESRSSTPLGAFSAEHVYADQSPVGRYAVSLRAVYGSFERSAATNLVVANRAPSQLTLNPTTASEDSPFSAVLTASDVPADVLTWAKLSGPAWVQVSTTGSVSGTPVQANVGPNLLAIEARDEDGGIAQAEFSLTVVNINDAPVILFATATAVTEGSTTTVTAGIVDEDDAALDIAVTWFDGTGTEVSPAVATGTVILWHLYPDEYQFGDYSVRLVVTDASGASATQWFGAKVVNLPPSGIFMAPTSAVENVPFSGQLHAVDVAADPITWTKTGGAAWLAVSAAGLVTGTPGDYDTGPQALSVEARDDVGASSAATLSVFVAPVNDAPVIGALSIAAVQEGSSATLSMGLSDVDHSSANVRIDWGDGGVQEMSLATGTASLKHFYADDDADDRYTIQVTATDGAGLAAAGSTEVTVTNRPPDAFGVAASTGTQYLLFAQKIGVNDVPADILTWSLTSGPSWISLSTTGVLSGTPRGGQAGTFTIQAHVVDDDGGADDTSFSITIFAGNAPPIAADDSFALTDSAVLSLVGPVSGASKIRTFASFQSPEAVVSDAAGNIYVGGGGEARILRISPAGVVTTFAGTGTAGFSGDGGPATSAQIRGAYGMAFDSAGNFYFADFSNSRVRRISPAGIITTVAGNGVMANSGDGGLATAASIQRPYALAIDAAGALYISDPWSNVVRRVAANGIITRFAGTGVSGYSGDGGPAVSAMISSPLGLAADAAGNVFLSDNGLIRWIAPNGVISTIISGLSGANGLALDREGRLYFANKYTNQVRRLGLDGLVENLVGSGVAGSAGDGGSATAAQLNQPAGVALAPTGDVLIADWTNNRIRRVDGATLATVLTNDTDEDGGLLTAVLATGPAQGALALRADGAFAYVPAGGFSGPDEFFYRASDGQAQSQSAKVSIDVTAVNQAPAVPVVLVGPSVEGATAPVRISLASPDFTHLALNVGWGDGSPDEDLPAAATGLLTLSHRFPDDSPPGGYVVTVQATDGRGLAAARQTRASVTNAAPTGLTVDVTTAMVTIPFSARLAAVDVAADPLSWTKVAGPAWLSLTPAGLLSGIPQASDLGTAALTVTVADGDGGTTTQAIPITVRAFNQAPAPQPDSYSAVEDGRLAVQMFTSSESIIRTLAGNGVSGSSGDGGPSTAARVALVTGVASDPAGNIYIADNFNWSVRKISPQGIITKFAGGGASINDGAPALSAQIKTPNGIAWTEAGELLIAAAGNGRIRRVRADGIIETVAAGVASPYGVTASKDWVYYSDAVENRVYRVPSTGGTPQHFAGGGSITGDGAPATQSSLPGLRGVAVGPDGLLYIAHQSRIRRVNAQGLLETVAGREFGSGTLGDGGPASSSEVNNPSGIAFDSAGRLYIADSGNNRIRVVDLAGFIWTLAGTGQSGYGGDGGPAGVALLNFPMWVGATLGGHVVVPESNNRRVRIIRADQGAGLLSNDSEPDGEALTAALDVMPANGKAYVDANGSFLYVPNKDFSGVDTFVYSATDGKDPRAAVVTITVAGTPDAPIVGPLSTPGGLEGTPIALTAVLTEPDGQPMGVSVNWGDGAVQTYSNYMSGTSIFTHTYSDDNAADSYLARVTATDTESAQAYAEIAVPVHNSSPVVVGISTPAGVQYSSFSAQLLSADVAADSRTWIAVSVPSWVSVSTGGLVAGKPGPGQAGPQDLLVKVTDDEGYFSTGTVHLEIARVDEPPSLSALTAGSAVEGSSATVTALISDPEGSTNTVVLDWGDGSASETLTGISVGTTSFSHVYADNNQSGLFKVRLTLPSSLWLAVSSDVFVSVFNSSPVIVGLSTSTGVQHSSFSAQLLAADVPGDPISWTAITVPAWVSLSTGGRVTGTPGAGQYGPQDLTVRATDDDGAAATATLRIEIARFNLLPIALDDSYATAEGTVLSRSSTTGILANDTDGDGDALTAVLSTPPSRGSLELAPDGGFVYTPLAGFFGIDTFTYSASDGLGVSPPAQAVIQVLPVGVPEFASLAVSSAVEGAPTALSLILVDSDDAASDLTVNWGDGTAPVTLAGTATGPLTLSHAFPDDSPAGGYPLLLQIADPRGHSSSTQTAAVVTNVAPSDLRLDVSTAMATVAYEARLAATDVPADSVTWEKVAGPTWLSVGAGGLVTGTPGASDVGTTSLTVKARDDDSGVTQAQFSIVVRVFNRAPVALPDSFSGTEDTVLRLVLETSSASIITTFAGNGGSGSTGNGGQATLASISNPFDVITDTSGNVFFVDKNFHQVRKISPTGIITRVAGQGTVYSGFSGDGGPADAAQLSNPQKIALTEAGELLIADTGNGRIRRVSASGIIDTLASGRNFKGVTSKAGNTYVSVGGENKVFRLLSDGQLQLVAGGGTSNANNVPALQAVLKDPSDLKIGPDGLLYIVETAGHRVRRISSSGTIQAVAGFGGNGFYGDGGLATSAYMNQPGGIAFDPLGRLCIADTWNHRVRRVGLDGYIQTVAGTGQTTFSPPGDGVAAGAATLYAPLAVGFMGDGDMLVADTYHARIRRVNADSGGSVLSNDSDPDGDVLSALLVTQPAHGGVTLDLNGTFTYQPLPDYYGSDSFVYSASDGKDLSAPASVTLIVGGINDPPQLGPISLSGMMEGVVGTVTGVLSDVDDSSLSAFVNWGDGTPAGTVAIGTGAFTVSHIYADDTGTSTRTISLQFTDSSGAVVSRSTATGVLNVAPGNLSLSPSTATFGEPYVGQLAAYDVPADPLTWALLQGPSWVTVSTDGRVSGLPGPTDAGAASLLVQASDDDGGVSNTTVTVLVRDVADVTAPRTVLSIGSPRFGAEPVFVASTSPFAFQSADAFFQDGDGLGVGVATLTVAVNGATSTSVNQSTEAAFAFVLTLGEAAEGVVTVSYGAADREGNYEALQTTTVVLDRSAPDTELRRSSPSFGAFVSTRTVLSFFAVDRGSIPVGLDGTRYALDGAPLAPAPAAFALSLPEGPVTVSYLSSDRLGNEEVLRSTQAILDASAPQIAIATPAARYQTGGAALEVVFSTADASDPEPTVSAWLRQLEDRGTPRGARPAELAVFRGQSIAPADLDDGVWELQVSATDFVDNAAFARSAPFEVVHDALPPLSGLSAGEPRFEPAAGGAVFITTRTQLTLTSRDDLAEAGDGAGLGVSSQEVLLGTSAFAAFANPQASSGTPFVSTFTLPGSDGAALVQFRARDLLGNTEPFLSRDFVLDGTPPSLSAVFGSAPVLRAPAFEPWFPGDVLVTWQAADAGAGVGSVNPPSTVTAEGRALIAVGTASDRLGNSVSVSTSLNVDRTSPAVDAGSAVSILEGSSATLTALVSDNLDAAPALTWFSGDRATATTSVVQFYPQQGEFDESVTAIDHAGHAASDTVRVTVLNAAPEVSAGRDRESLEGQVLDLTASFSDPGPLDRHTASADWGDGTSTPMLIEEAGGAGTARAQHSYADEGTFLVTITVADEDGGLGTSTFTARVLNVAPDLARLPAVSIFEGAPFTLSGATFTDAGGIDFHTGTVDWGDGTTAAAVVSSKTVLAQHTYGDEGSYTVTVTVADQDGGASTRTFTATVSNVAPSLAALENQTAPEGSPWSLQGATFTDPGFLDT
ncbi:tandem-95 repeat protein, partial [bacterium]